MLTLVIDTCLGACQAAAFRDGGRLAARSEAMQRGHQERLAPMIAEVMAEAGLAFSDVTRIAVTLGPGSFTGIRVGVASALGLRLATEAEIVGLGTLEALAASAGAGRAAGVIDARRGQVYFQAFDGGRATAPPDVLSLAQAEARLDAAGAIKVVGPGAHLFTAKLGAERTLEIAAPDLDALAHLAERADPLADPRPLYLRAPDIRQPGR